MITATGPKVVEFNCRFGDPEAQAVLPLLKTDLVDVMFRVACGKNLTNKIEIHDKWAMCVVISSGGYPGDYEKGKVIYGLDKDYGDDIVIFHAGTKSADDNSVVTGGGRVLGVTAVADDYYSVRDRVYWAVGKITFDKAYYRKDIGEKALRYLN
jgi:phosphoribosylamine--glycine ligase